ncbi:MAG: hypothetical protein SF051_14195 [Elusimicrobiota bacterium]|nr:hypothetical protein [Elusimicrobiota bacterium]
MMTETAKTESVVSSTEAAQDDAVNAQSATGTTSATRSEAIECFKVLRHPLIFVNADGIVQPAFYRAAYLPR